MSGTTAITDNMNGEPIQRPLIVRIFAHFISYVFHPLFIPVYMAGYLLFVHPLLFAGFSDSAKFRLLATIVVNLTLLPAVTVFLCRRLGFISSVQMDTQKERIIPL